MNNFTSEINIFTASYQNIVLVSKLQLNSLFMTALQGMNLTLDEWHYGLKLCNKVKLENVFPVEKSV